MANLGETKPINRIIFEVGGDDYVFEGGGGGQPGPDTVGTEQIIDGAVEEQDLHDDVKDRMTITHDSSTGGLRLGGYAKPGNVPANVTQEAGAGEDEVSGGGPSLDDLGNLDDLPGGGFNDDMQEEEGD